MRVLVIDDEALMRQTYRAIFKTTDWQVYYASNAEEGRILLRDRTPDVILCDVGLPDQRGTDLVQRFREKGVTTPILFVSARGEPEDKILGLDAGGDDYISKPFDSDELLERIKALYRRNRLYNAKKTPTTESSTPEDPPFYGDMGWSSRDAAALIGGEKVPLPPLQGRLWCYFLENPERILTHDMIIHRVWGPNGPVEENSVAVLVYRLKRRLASQGADRHIETVPGFGYRLKRS
jgi:DNA-binding response OmpR family regulator